MTRVFAKEEIDTIRQGIDIVEVVSEYVELKKRGKNLVGLCPFHSEKTPSFSVDPEKQMFYCFGCGVGGDIFSFLMQIDKLTFPEAVENLAQRLGITLQPGDSRQRKRLTELEQVLEANRRAKQFYQYLLYKHPRAEQARRYLINRGLTGAVIKKFHLGYAPDDWTALVQHMQKQGISTKVLEQAGLINAREHRTGYYDRFRNRIIFPIFNGQGRVIGFGGRILDDSQPKYLNSPETIAFHKGKTLYGINWAAREIRKAGQAIIMEGYMDVISAHQFGLENVVASLGTSLTKEQAKMLKRYTREVVIAYDADAAGTAATLRGMEILRQEGLNVKVMKLPEGLDPDDFLRQYGLERFKSFLLEQTFSLVDYKIKIAMANHDRSTVEGKAKIIDFVAKDLASMDSEVEREEYVRLLARKLGLSELAIFGELRKHFAKMQKNGTTKDKIEKNRHNNDGVSFLVEPAYVQAERNLIAAMLHDPEVFWQVKKEIGLQGFMTSYCKEIFAAFESLMGRDSGRSTPGVPAMLLDGLNTDKARAEFSKLLLQEQPHKEVIQDSLVAVKRNILQFQIEGKQREISEAEEAGSEQKVAELTKDLWELQKRLQKMKEK